MILTVKQEQGLKIIVDRYKNNEKYTVVAGYAGSGKSTLVRFAIEALNVNPSSVAYATFTGKAAEVLRKKGNHNAITLHKLLYESVPRPDGTFFRVKRQELACKVVVIDEVSMVPKSMIEQLLSYNVYVIFLGDPQQLLMIDKDESHDLLDHPHIFLDEIMRQAQESEIIQLTMKIRNGETIPYMKGNEVQILPKKELVDGMYSWADIILCATNKTRHDINCQMRAMLGYEGEIKSGERIIIKRNYWNDCNEEGDALVNGTLGTFYNPYESFVQLPPFIKNNRRNLPIYGGEFIPDGGKTFGNVDIDRDFLVDEVPCVSWKVAYQVGKMRKRIGDILPRQATYGYSLTCHSAQGSEWDRVLVVEENFPFDREEHKRWLYTAATRAAEKLVVVR